MKFNKWTLGLAAVGVVSLTSVALAEEKPNAVQSALSSTTISGYVDTSAQWNIGNQSTAPGGNYPPYTFGGANKADGFDLNVVQLSIAKAMDESEWASGYRADLWFGPDAATLGSLGGGNQVAIRQAYVALRTPVGNGIDWKVGVFDSIIGYESLESGNNPNMTRSYGFSIEPTTLTGLLGTYRFTDEFSATFAIANSYGPAINGSQQLSPNGTSFKTYTGALAYTAPSEWGWAAGSSFYAGFITGYNPNAGGGTGLLASFTPFATGGQNVVNYYFGSTLNTGLTGLKVGAALDYLYAHNQPTTANSMIVPGLYVSYQATEKLSFHGRGEYVYVEGNAGAPNSSLDGFELTATVQYDLWENVISRLEFRWDHSCDVNWLGPNTTGFVNSQGINNQKNATMLAANFIYKF